MDIKDLKSILNLHILSQFMLKDKTLIEINIRKNPSVLRIFKISRPIILEKATSTFLGKSHRGILGPKLRASTHHQFLVKPHTSHLALLVV